MKRATVDDVMSWSPCGVYPRERVAKLFAGGKNITHRGIAKLDIPAEDRFWALIEYADWSGHGNTLHEFACREAEDALKAAGVTDERSWNAIKVKRAWVREEATDDELSAARFAAESAAESASRSAARYTARYASRSASRSAAWSAARSAARYASRSAARSAARERQVARLIAMLDANQ